MSSSPSLVESLEFLSAEESIASFSAILLEFGQSMFIEALIMLLAIIMFLWSSKSWLFRTRTPVGKVSGTTSGTTWQGFRHHFARLFRTRNPLRKRGYHTKKGRGASKGVGSTAVSQQEKEPEAQRVQKFVVSLLQKANKDNPGSVLAQYQELAQACGGNLRRHIPDDQNGRSMYLSLIRCAVGLSTAVPQRSVAADGTAAWRWTCRLLADMRAFGFPRSDDFYGAALKMFGNAQLAREGLRLHDEMTADGVVPGDGVLILLLTAAVSCGKFSRALSFFDRIAEVSQPSPRTIMTVLRAHSANKDWQAATKLLDRMASLGTPPDNLILNSVISLCVSCSEIDGAQLLLQRWKDITDVVSCNILLKGCAQLPDLQRADAILENMIANGPAPNLISYNTVMDCAVRSMRSSEGARGQPEAKSLLAAARRSWELIDELIARGLEPDRYTCSTLVKGVHLSGRTVSTPGRNSDIDRVIDILNRIGATALQAPMLDGKQAANELMEVLFNTLLDACISVRDLDRMAKVFGMMQPFGVKATAVTYGTLIKASGQSGHVKQCHAAWQDMMRNSVQPTIVTFGCYIDACIRNDAIDNAEEIFESMRTMGHVRPNAVIYTSLIRGFAQAKQPRKALEFYRRMRKEGVEPTSVTFNSLLDIVGRQLSEPQVLQELIDDMCKAGIAPNVNTYSILIKGACSSGNLQEALKFFRQVQSKGLAFDSVAFHTLLLACSKHEQVADAEEIFEEMRRIGMTPTQADVSVMVKMYGKARMPDKAIGISEVMEKEYGQTPNIWVFACLIQACQTNRQIRPSWEIFNKMVTSGIQPDAIMYGSMIHGCVYLEKCTYAMSLVRHAYRCSSPAGPERESPFMALPPLKHAVPLKNEVMQMLLAALRRKEQNVLAAELQGIMASNAEWPTETGKSQGGRHNRYTRPDW